VPDPAIAREPTLDEIRIFQFGFSFPVQAPYVNLERTVLLKNQQDVKVIKTDKHEQRCLTKFFFLQGKRSNAIYGELGGVLGEAGISLAIVKRDPKSVTDD
jgi:hypothetical protein